MFSAETPTKVLAPGYYTANGTPDRTYDIAPDGRHFLMIKEETRTNDSAGPSIIVVQHFDEELKRGSCPRSKSFVSLRMFG